jgi:hypothetical protein
MKIKIPVNLVQLVGTLHYIYICVCVEIGVRMPNTSLIYFNGVILIHYIYIWIFFNQTLI